MHNQSDLFCPVSAGKVQPWEVRSISLMHPNTVWAHHHHYHHHHQFLNREGRWGTTNDFATGFFLQCPLGLAELQACLFPDVVFPPIPLSALFSSPFHCALARWFWPDLMNGKHDHTIAVCIFLRSSGDLHVVQLPAGSWHGLPRW